MDCLFIHGNYPAQFKHLAPLLAQAGHRVIFLTNCSDCEEQAQLGIEIRKYELHRSTSDNTHHYLLGIEDATLKGQAVLRAISKILEEGFRPRFVVTHGGTGIGLFIKDLLPEVIHIGYFEWYFKPETTKYLVSNFDLDTQLSTGIRNLPILQELERCDAAVIPTEWQKKQFPQAYQEKLNVIFDGIDKSFFRPKNDANKIEEKPLVLTNRNTKEEHVIPERSKILSYATRGMETLRGFPEFMRTLPDLTKDFDDLYVIIAGTDRRAYSYDAPRHQGSWKQLLLEELKGKLPKERIVFTGLLTYQDYRSLLWRSNLHCYFTKPYVTSWSLFEAAACGCKLAVNDNEATRGILLEKSVTWVCLEDQNKLTNQLKAALDSPTICAEILPGFDLESCLQKWEKLLNKTLQTN